MQKKLFQHFQLHRVLNYGEEEEDNNNNNNNNKPVIIGTSGTNAKSLRKYRSNIPGKHEIKEPQKKSHSGH